MSKYKFSLMYQYHHTRLFAIESIKSQSLDFVMLSPPIKNIYKHYDQSVSITSVY